MTHGSLFSGIGGFDLAAEWMGWENLFHCEWNEFGQKVLKHYWPNAESFHDITKTDFTPYANRISILSGGFPCQPYSIAGKRKGTADSRHLWPQMLRAIREIQPRWVVGENVFGLINWSNGLVFHEVQTDLEAEGYEVFPYVLPAAAVNAPHRRDRVWFVAYRNIEQREWKAGGFQSQPFNGSTEATTNPHSTPTEHTIQTGRNLSSSEISTGNAANTKNIGHESPGSTRARRARFKNSHTWDATNLHDTGLEGRKIIGSLGTFGKKPYQQPTGHFCTNWENFPTQSPVCTGNDGFPTELDGITFSKWRNESIKAAGNAIVPQVALQIFKSIEQYENLVS